MLDAGRLEPTSVAVPTTRLRPKTPRRGAFLSSSLTAVLASWRPIGWLLSGWLLSTLLNLVWHPACYLPEREAKQSAVPEMDLRPRFVLFGDSLSQRSSETGGWGAALQDKYARKVSDISMKRLPVYRVS